MLCSFTKSSLPLLTCPVCDETTQDNSHLHQLACPTCGTLLRDDEPTPSETELSPLSKNSNR